MSLPEPPLFEKVGLTVFRNNVLSLRKEEFSLLKSFYIRFVKPATIFLFFRALKDLSVFCFLK